MHTQVVVIGAGVSGIKAATDLHAQSIDTLILEGRDRIGGRIYTYESPVTKRKYDTGASWFHETGFNPLFKKSLALGNVEYVFDDSSAVFIGPDGEIPGDYKLGPVVNEMKLFATRELDDSINLHTLSNSYIIENKDVLSLEQIKYAPQVLRMAEIMNGSWDLANGSKSNPPYGGRDAFVVNHYETVLDNELKDYPKDKIKLSTTVKGITKSDVITITTESGETITCDYCIITVPQSIITLPSTAKAAIKFEPELPAHITDDFNKLATTSFAKIFFEFDKPFWDANVEKMLFIGKPDESFSESVIKGTPDLQAEVATTEFNKPSDSVPQPFEFPFLCANLQAVKKVPTLFCLVPSPVSMYFEKADKEAIWEIFKPMLSKLGTVTEPLNIFTTNWNDDPFSRGSLSAVKPNGILVNDGFVKGWDNIRFAGEHTAYEGHGCVHGAWLTGKREADAIIKQIAKK